MWRSLSLVCVLSVLLSQLAFSQVPQRQPPKPDVNTVGQGEVTQPSLSAQSRSSLVAAPWTQIPMEEVKSLTNKLVDGYVAEFKDKPFSATEGFLEIADTSKDTDPVLKLKKLRILALLMCREVLTDRYRAGLINLRDVQEVDTKLTESAMVLSLSKKQRLEVLASGRNRAASMTHLIREKQRIGARGGEADAEALATVFLLDAEIAYQEELLAQ